jgi:YVTN family beta-propeller protein
MIKPLTAIAVGCALLAPLTAFAQQAPDPAGSDGPYHVLKSAKVGGEGGFDYVYADSDGRKVYIARSGPAPRVSIYNLDTLEPIGEIPNTSAHGAAVDIESHHGFATSKPVAMWDSKTLTPLKTIAVDGRPDGILGDPYNHRIYILSHSAPNVTVIDAKDGAVLGTIDIGGAPEQAATDGAGHIYIDIEDQGSVAVIDANTMKLTATNSLNGKGGGNAGLALDAKHHVLFVACRAPQVMVMLDSRDGKYLADLPIGRGCDGVVFNPETDECFSSQGDSTLTVIKETDPTHFAIEQTVKTMTGAKTLTLDGKTGKILLIAAEYQAPAVGTTPPANGRPARRPMVPGSFTILVVGK